MLLAPIIKNATSKHVHEFADSFLFTPLGITNYEWVKYSEFWTKTEGGEFPAVEKPEPPIKYPAAFADYPNTGSGLKMLPRDMAKFGQLYLNKGIWHEKQLINKNWIDQSTQPQFGNSEYGYGWRLRKYTVNNKEISCYYATGFGLQSISVFPELELVIVFTQQNYRTMPEGEEQTQDIIENNILKALKE